jgi:comEA protein
MAAYRGIPASAVVTDTVPSSAKTISKESININTAGVKVLKKLPGIGSVYAQHIIDYRNKHGAFTSKKELLKVSGIGDARFGKISPYIVLGDLGDAAKMKAGKQHNSSSVTAEEQASPKEVRINVNTADVKALKSLPGIGEVYAQHIIEYRQKNGSFTVFEQLIKVDGIGEKRLEKIKPLIKLAD